MIKKIEDFISGLGDFNHLFVGLCVMVLVSFLAPQFIAYAAMFVSAFYYGKEVGSHAKLGEIPALNPKNWASHDRNQTFYVWAGVWIYTITFNVLF